MAQVIGGLALSMLAVALLSDAAELRSGGDWQQLRAFGRSAAGARLYSIGVATCMLLGGLVTLSSGLISLT